MASARERRLRWAEASLIVGATVAMAVTARSPEAGEGWRTAFVIAALTASGVVTWTGLRRSWSTRAVLGLAVLLRLVVFPLPPALSDDGYRYVWDGQLQAQHGIDPYQYRPDDPVLARLHGESVYERLNSPSYYTVYPPLAQLLFALGGFAYPLGWLASWYAIKAFFVLIELAGVYLVSRWVRGGALALYAWHPLAVIEGAGQGHLEIAAVGLLLGAAWAARHRRGAAAGALIAMAGWVKLIPFVALPFAAKRLGRRVWIGGLLMGAVLFAPYASAYWWPHVRESLDLYVRLFEFNAGPYYALKGFGRLWTGDDWSKQIGPLLQYGFLTLSLLAYLASRRGARAPGLSLPILMAGIFGLFFALATTVHPWYLLLVLAFIPLLVDRPRTRLFAGAWLWLATCSMGTYWLYAGPAWGNAVAVAVGWSGWVLFLVAWAVRLGLPRLMRHRGRRKWRWVATALPELTRGASLLDLGAGEGHVGWAANQEAGAIVQLADVVDYHTAALPFVRYDGRRLPFEDDDFDATLLVFVLHHADAPERVLKEAARVTRGPVVVMESLVVNRPQARLLRFLDTVANRLRAGGLLRPQEQTLDFRTDDAWRRTFTGLGFRVVSATYRGRWIHPQALYVLDGCLTLDHRYCNKPTTS